MDSPSSDRGTWRWTSTLPFIWIYYTPNEHFVPKPSRRPVGERLSPRPYRLGKRQAATDQSRTAILTAARSILETGDSFSIEAVARRADVARMTVYHQFGSRRGLLESLFDFLAERGGMRELPAAFHRPDPIDALMKLIDVFVHFWSSDRVVLRRLRGMAALDSELDQTLWERNEGRRNALRAILGRIRGGEGRPRRATEDTVDLLYTLLSFEAVDVLAGKTRTPEEVLPIIKRATIAILGLPDQVADESKPSARPRSEPTEPLKGPKRRPRQRR